MYRLFYIVLALGIVSISMSCRPKGKDNPQKGQINIDSLLSIRYKKLLDYPLDSTAFPRSYSDGNHVIHTVAPKDWTSGFFPGNLWLLFQLTGQDAYSTRAKEWTAFMEKEKFNNGTHDMGFKIFSSFGKGFQITGRKDYEKVILKSAKTLSTRFNEKVGSLRSWDWNKNVWEFPVIIDNMMNLELLFEATKISGDSTFYEIAVKHANTSLKNHFRKDGSSYHVVVYDTITGKVRNKVTHQGFSDESSWARGQGWAIYGFTMAYRYTKNALFLFQAQRTMDFYLENKNLPEDGIPYWDFDDPAIPDAPRDVSAATVIASACFEMFGYTQDQRYLDYANKVLGVLRTDKYILNKDIDAPFILDHSTGNWPKHDEIDGPIVYADFYFLEALLRQKDQVKPKNK